VSIYSDKKIAAELRNIGGNFLPPKIYQNCEDWVYTDAVLYSSTRRNWKHSSHPSLRRSFNQTTRITGIKPRPQWWKAYVKAI
jgi:hypothetical protein